MDHNAFGRRRLLGWGGLAAAGVLAAGTPLVGALPGRAAPAPTDDPIRAYEKYLAKLAADGKFSGVVLLVHRGGTVLSRGYGMADREKKIPNGAHTAFTLSSAGKPFHAVAIMRLAQEGKVRLYDTLGTHLTGYAKDISEQVTIHHLLTASAGINAPELDNERVFRSREEVHTYYAQWSRQAKLVVPPGSGDQGHTDGAGAGITMVALIIEAVTGKTYWDYVQESIFGRCGMIGSGFFTRPRWLTDERIAHPYMALADGSQVDAIRNLDKSSPVSYMLGKNPGRAFIDAPGDGGFVTAPDLVRFARALGDGTLLDPPWADVLTAPNTPHAPQTQGLQAAPGDASFGAYGMPVKITSGQWQWSRGGANPGVGAAWTIYPDSGWVSVILANSDGAPLQEIAAREEQAVLGRS